VSCGCPVVRLLRNSCAGAPFQRSLQRVVLCAQLSELGCRVLGVGIGPWSTPKSSSLGVLSHRTRTQRVVQRCPQQA